MPVRLGLPRSPGDDGDPKKKIKKIKDKIVNKAKKVKKKPEENK